MRTKLVLIVCCACLFMAWQPAAQAAKIPIKLNMESASNLSVAYSEEEECYILNTTGASPQYIDIEALTEELGADFVSLSFEYQSEAEAQYLQLMYSKEDQWNTSRAHVYDPLTITSDWKAVTLDMTSDRKRYSWGKVGEMLRLRFFFNEQNITFKLRNIRFNDKNMAFHEITLKKNGVTLVEAEDYNIGGLGEAYNAHQYKLNLPTYVNPTGDKYPILAWGMQAARVHDQLVDMEECGFNIAMSKVSTMEDIQGLIDASKGTGVKHIPGGWLIESTDIPKWRRQMVVDAFKDSECIVGWGIKDEPWASEFSTLADQHQQIKEKAGANQLTYLNLLHAGTDYNVIGCKDFLDYIQRSVREVGTGYISYDCYPIVMAGEKRAVRPFFYESLETAVAVGRQYDIPVWAFVRCRGDVINDIVFPVPTLADMRFQAFTNLAYGVQCMQYYTYTWLNSSEEEGANMSPLQIDAGKTWQWIHTPTWDMVQAINKEIHALTWVFLGCELIDASHTGKSLPTGTKALTTLPKEFDGVEGGDSGLLITQLKKGDNRFLMIVTRDVNDAQEVTVTKSSAQLNRVQPDGSLVASPELTETVTLEPGDYILYQWTEENEEPVYGNGSDKFSNETDYRIDSEAIYLMSNENLEGGHGLFNMGDDKWNQYTIGSYRSSAKRTISKAQAVENWGSWFKYDILVNEDMDVNIYVGHSVQWEDYGPIAAYGLAPGWEYNINTDLAMNWPKRYAASMILTLDKTRLKTNQTARPVSPNVYEPDGSTFNAILADEGRWTSTLVKGAANDTLWLWPAAGGNNDIVTRYHEKPDYVNVHLTKGLHTLTVTSLCSPWIFDCLKFEDAVLSGVHANKTETNTMVRTAKGGLQITGGDADIYTTGGVHLGKKTGYVSLPAGIYVVKTENQSHKMVVK